MNDLTPLSLLKKRLDILINEDWKDFEVETLMLCLGLLETPLLRDKLGLLKSIVADNELFYTDVLFFLHATSVMNNKNTSFDHIPHVSSLEMAFSIIDMSKLLGVELEKSPAFSKDLRIAISYLLKEEGYSVILAPFSIVGISGLVEGQTLKDSADKEKAIYQYVSSMYN